MTDLALKLQAIRDQLRHWSNWNTEMRRREGLPTENDTHVIAVPPHWPTHGMLRQWADTIEEARTLADATNDPADLSSLRKGAEVMREAIEDAIEKLNTYRGAAVQTVIDQLEAALVSGSREEQS